MPRIHEHHPRDRWQFLCPECESPSWRVHDGTFGCRACGLTTKTLIDQQTGEEIHRRKFEFVGPHADTRAAGRGRK